MSGARAPRWFEEFTVGDRLDSAASDGVTFEAAEIKAFAARFDPQPFHLDEAAGAASIFGGLAASGWHTASTTMRLLVRAAFAGTENLVGLGVDGLRWPRPVHPGDTLHVEIEVLRLRGSISRPTHGIVTFRVVTKNQDDAVVQEMTTNVLWPRRP